MAVAAFSGPRMSCSKSKSESESKNKRDEVYVAAIPLRASKTSPAHLLFSTAYSLNFWDFQHFMLILKSKSKSKSKSQSQSPTHQYHHQDATITTTVYDFQPSDPENIWVAAAALSGRKVAGVIQARKLPKLPTRKCWFVGYVKDHEDATDAVHKFNHTWDTHLILGYHDCRHYSQDLVEYLTGNKAILHHLRAKQDKGVLVNNSTDTI